MDAEYNTRSYDHCDELTCGSDLFVAGRHMLRNTYNVRQDSNVCIVSYSVGDQSVGGTFCKRTDMCRVSFGEARHDRDSVGPIDKGDCLDVMNTLYQRLTSD